MLPLQSNPVKSRVTVVMLGCLVFGGMVIGRAAVLQLTHDERLEQMARRQFQSKVLIRPRRGAVLDRNGEPLAVNVETRSLAADPSKVPNKQTLARLLAKATDMPYSKLMARLKEKREFLWIKRHISESELNELKKWRIIDGGGDLMTGLFLVKESQRVYPHGELAAHTLGTVNVDSDGLEGVELWLNERMRGKVVSVTGVKDALGRPTFIDAAAAKNVKDGESVTLTLDASLQFSVEQELRNSVRRTNARGGSVIVMNAVNGEILAMANEPSYNPNQKGIPADRKRNRAITDGYEPGSTLKSVLLASALTHGMKLSDQVWGGKGELVVQGRKITEAETHEKFEWLSLKELIQVSNVGSAKLALKLGPDHFLSTLKAFGFGARSGVGFPGEISGRIPARKDWQPLTTANIGFGQGLLVTPIQMVRAYAAFLNGGWLVQPTLVRSSVPEIKAMPPHRVLSQKASEDVLTALRTVTEEKGTGMKAVLPGYVVAGKTGTAQTVDPVTKSYSRSRYISSFIGYAVGADPKIVIFAAIDEPKGIYYASETAAPLFKDVLNAVVNRFGLPADPAAQKRMLANAAPANKDTIATSQAKPVPAPIPLVQAEPAQLEWLGTNTNGQHQWKMPPLAGLSPREALRALKGHLFRMELHGSGVIRQQIPEAGKSVAEGDRIRLTLAEP